MAEVSNAKQKAYTQLISAEEFLALRSSNADLVVFDTRFDLMDPGLGERQYDESHLSGAHYLHLDRDLSDPITADSGRHPLPNPARLAVRLSEAGVSTKTQVCLYDAQGSAFAARAWWLLRWLGHESVAVINGGLAALEAAGAPVDSALPEVEPGLFEIRPSLERVVSTEQLQTLLQDDQAVLIDVRAPERFLGEVEPLDPVAGHVPGAINLPLTGNLNQGVFNNASVIAERYSEVLEDLGDRSLILMCGSGVTACHSRLALAHAGIESVSVYPGSWSEWIRDPKRPVAQGQ